LLLCYYVITSGAFVVISSGYIGLVGGDIIDTWLTL